MANNYLYSKKKGFWKALAVFVPLIWGGETRSVALSCEDAVVLIADVVAGGMQGGWSNIFPEVVAARLLFFV